MIGDDPFVYWVAMPAIAATVGYVLGVTVMATLYLTWLTVDLGRRLVRGAFGG